MFIKSRLISIPVSHDNEKSIVFKCLVYVQVKAFFALLTIVAVSGYLTGLSKASANYEFTIHLFSTPDVSTDYSVETFIVAYLLYACIGYASNVNYFDSKSAWSRRRLVSYFLFTATDLVLTCSYRRLSDVW